MLTILHLNSPHAVDREAQLADHPQDVGKSIFGNGDLCHLEGDIAAMATILAPKIINQLISSPASISSQQGFSHE